MQNNLTIRLCYVLCCCLLASVKVIINFFFEIIFHLISKVTDFKYWMWNYQFYRKIFSLDFFFTNNDEPITAECPTNTKSVQSVADMKYTWVENGNIMRDSSEHCEIILNIRIFSVNSSVRLASISWDTLFMNN